jgi:hypothetical protein
MCDGRVSRTDRSFATQAFSSQPDERYIFRVLLSYNFGMDAGTYQYGDVNLTATGARDSNRGVVLQARKNCHTRYGSNYAFSIYNDATLTTKNSSNNFTVTSSVTTALGP